jgi:hypothetical protein
VSKLNHVETVETVEGAEATWNGYEEREAVTLDQHIGVRIPGGKQSFQLSAVKIHGSQSFGDAEIPESLDGIIESKKSAEWRNMINDKNREWTDSPNQQESQTQPDDGLVHITSMRKTRARLILFTLTVTASFLSHGVSWQRSRTAEKSVDPGTCDTSPAFLWYSHRRFRRE